jgi:hypothetical protein
VGASSLYTVGYSFPNNSSVGYIAMGVLYLLSRFQVRHNEIRAISKRDYNHFVVQHVSLQRESKMDFIMPVYYSIRTTPILNDRAEV